MTHEMDVPATAGHLPTPAFRAALERQVIAALRDDLTMASIPPSARRSRRRDRMRLVAVLTLGMILGIGTQFASAQVRDARQRSELESALKVEVQIAAMRLQVARANHERVRKSYESGALSRQSLLDAAAELRTAELEVARLKLNVEEVQATSAAPRDELWAPRVNGRDFAGERLRLAAAAAQSRLKSAESAEAEVARRLAVGAVSQAAMAEASLTAAEARRDFQVIAQRLTLRDDALRQRMATDEITRQAQRFEVMADLMLAQKRLELARDRLALLRDRARAGAVDELDVKRAEVDVLEQQVELQRLNTRYQALQREGGSGDG